VDLCCFDLRWTEATEQKRNFSDLLKSDGRGAA